MWTDPPDTLILKKDELHIWCGDLDAGKDSEKYFLDFLAPFELRRAGKFKFETDRQRFIGARGILRYLLGKYLKKNPAGIEFEYTAYGKPLLKGKNELKFNISHSENAAIFSFVKHYEIGVDIEFIKQKIEFEEIARRFFSKNETLKLLKLPEEKRAEGFFNCWTRKESFIKAVGEGLSFPLDRFEVSLEPGEKAELLATHFDPPEVSRWTLRSFIPFENFIGAAAVRGNLESIRFFRF